MTRVAVVGLGLIGGSAALAFEARAYDRDAGARSRARDRGIDAVDSLVEAVGDAEVVLLAVATEEMPALLLEAAAAAPQALLTDAASLKRSIAAAAAALPAGMRFVGGHPMAGSQTPGLADARADLFRDRPWLIVPTERSDVRSIAAVRDLVHGIGACPIVVDAERHDALMTWVSHLPLAVASALARAVSAGSGTGLDRIAGPGLLDTTRVAQTPAGLALELASGDPDALASALEAVRGQMDELARSLRQRDIASLRSYFDEAAKARRALEKPGL